MAEGSVGAGRERTLAPYLAVWQGEADLAELDRLVTPSYVGHMGAGSRDLAQLKGDIAAYRAAAEDVRFHVEHRFGNDPFVATRVSATAIRRSDGARLVAAGLNISRWDGDLLAEEWAVWEPLHPAAD